MSEPPRRMDGGADVKNGLTDDYNPTGMPHLHSAALSLLQCSSPIVRSATGELSTAEKQRRLKQIKRENDSVPTPN